MTHPVEFVALSLLPMRCRRDASLALAEGESPGSILERLLSARRPGREESPATLRRRAATVLARGGERHLRAIAFGDAEYPSALAAIPDPPFVLWTRGVATALDGPAVAIVGSRAASPYGLAVAERLAADLAARGVVIVSGLARGVDSAAHRGALAGSGATVAVLGSGADVIYPPEHEALAEQIAVTGAVVSELAPGTPPRKEFFPLRNRIISGLVRAVVVIEAGERSGSLITARAALDQGRDVLAVPGSILSGRNRGAHGLLRDGAKIVESANDVLEEMGMPATDGASSGRPEPSGVAEGRSSGLAGDAVLACLPAGEPCDVDAISERTGLNTARLLPRLFELELRGLVRRAGGGRFARV